MKQVNLTITDEHYKILVIECAKEQLISGEIVKPATLVYKLLANILDNIQDNEQDNEHNITMKSKSVIIPDFKKNSIQDSEPVSIPIVNEDNMSDSEVANSFNDLNYDF